MYIRHWNIRFTPPEFICFKWRYEEKMKLVEFSSTIDLVAAVEKGEIAKFQIAVENPPLPNRYFGVPNGDPIPSRPQIEAYFAQNGISWKFISTAILP